jgi:EmrB/QacA subfamily drug resistance transporter
MLGGSTADRIGRRRVFQTGLTIFGLGSLACSLTPDIHLLIAARVLQGLGGSMMNPVAMSIITNAFVDRRERAQAIGVWGATSGAAMALGPMLGGWLTESISWRAIFWINVPIAVAALVLTQLFVPESRAERPRRIDPVGQALMIVLLVSLVYALIEAPGRGWTSPTILVLLAVALVAGLVFVAVESHTTEPLLDVRFFRSVSFSSAALTAVLAFAAFGSFLFVNTLYLQDVRGLSPFDAGVWMLPMAAVSMVFSVGSGRLVSRFGTLPSLVLSGLTLAASGAMLAFLRSDTPVWYLMLAYVLFGLGSGAVNAPITTSAVSGMPLSQAGVAAAVASTSRQAGTTVGVAVSGTLTGAGAGMIGAGFATSTHPLWWVTTGAGLAIAVVAVVASTAWAHRTTDRVRHLLEEPANAAG